MEIIKRTPQMKALARRLVAEGNRVGFVPTMGALHAGHLSLMQRARQMCDVVVDPVPRRRPPVILRSVGTSLARPAGRAVRVSRAPRNEEESRR